MKKIVNIIIENDGYLIKNNSNDSAFTRVMPQGIQRIPSIPFYHSAWLIMGNLLKPAVTDLVDVVNSQYGKIKKTLCMAAYPADALPADVRMIQQTLEYAGFMGVKMVSKTSLLKAEGLTNYIAISASERLVILEWYRDGIPTESRYYNKVSVGRNRLLSDIEKIQRRQAGSNMKVFVFDGCAELAGLYSVGEVVDENRELKLLVKTGYEQYKVKNPPKIDWVVEKKVESKPETKSEIKLDIEAKTNVQSKSPISDNINLSINENGSEINSGDKVSTNVGIDEDMAVVCVSDVLGIKSGSGDTKVHSDRDLERRLAMDINKPEEEFDEWAYKQAIGEEK